MKIKLAFILPNFFTSLSAFFGVMSIIASSQAKFEKAFIYIILSLIADGLDGRIARLTNTTSKFGVEFDSLADIIAFGVAPAMMLFFAIGENYGRFGALISGLFVVFGAIRLARFNVTTMLNDPRFFIGLPIPTAAVVLSSWIMLDIKYKSHFDILILIGAMFLAAFVAIVVYNYYIAIARDEDFGKRVREMVAITFGVAAISFIIGYITFY